jgi:hypothetical protein
MCRFQPHTSQTDASFRHKRRVRYNAADAIADYPQTVPGRRTSPTGSVPSINRSVTCSNTLHRPHQFSTVGRLTNRSDGHNIRVTVPKRLQRTRTVGEHDVPRQSDAAGAADEPSDCRPSSIERHVNVKPRSHSHDRPR